MTLNRPHQIRSHEVLSHLTYSNALSLGEWTNDLLEFHGVDLIMGGWSCRGCLFVYISLPPFHNFLCIGLALRDSGLFIRVNSFCLRLGIVISLV